MFSFLDNVFRKEKLIEINHFKKILHRKAKDSLFSDYLCSILFNF